MNREPAHVSPDERRGGDVPSQSQQRRREIQPETTGSCLYERPGMSARTAGHIQNPPPWTKSDGPADEGHSTGSIGFVTMGIQSEVVFTEPLFEPFGHESGTAKWRVSGCFK